MTAAADVRGALPDAAALAALFEVEVLAAAARIREGLDGLLEAERAWAASLAPSRRREVASARRCARPLLARLGAAEAPLLRAGSGAPAWPEGITGSLTHKHDACAVVVARAGAGLGLGLDLERAEPLDEQLWPRLLTERERARLPRDPARAGLHARCLFSAKESVFKALGGRSRAAPLRALAVELDLDPEAGRFRARTPVGCVPGRMLLAGSWLATGATLGSAGPDRG